MFKIIISASTSWSLFNARLDYCKSLKDDGFEVVLLSPRDEFTRLILESGLRWVDLPIKPRGKHLFQEIRGILFMTRFYRQEKPDIVHHFTPKINLYGSIAARLSGVRSIFNTFTGLGYLFSSQVSGLRRKIIHIIYRLGVKNTTNIFQNRENLRLFNQLKIGDSQRNIYIPGSGIDIERFKRLPEPGGVPIVLLASRFIEEKGILEFIEAARRTKAEGMPARFVLAGRFEMDQPHAISEEQVQAWVKEGLVEYWGWFNNMEAIYQQVHIVCLPTFYMEGLPKVLLEAAAVGRPVIATDVPGCRELLIDGENGIKIQPKDTEGLTHAIQTLINNPAMRHRMGESNRSQIENRFSTRVIFAQYKSLYKGELPAN